MLIPVGFVMLTLQGVSELIKRLACLAGLVDPREFEKQGAKPEDEIAAIASANKLDVPQVKP